MLDRILMVDDDPNSLAAYKRQLREFDIHVAQGGEQGTAALRERGPFAVVVSDMRMPGMNGVQFLSRVADAAPDTVRMMLTGTSDMQAAADAVNKGHVFRFLTKPCSAVELRGALDAAISQFRLVSLERELLEKTLSGTIRVLTDVLSLSNPLAFGRSSRIQGIVRAMGVTMRMERLWQLEAAAMLSQLGCIAVPAETLARAYRRESVTADEARVIARHAAAGQDLLANIPRLENIAAVIGMQEGGPLPAAGHPQIDRAWVEQAAAVLRIALDYDSWRFAGKDRAAALTAMATSGAHNTNILNALSEAVATEVEPQSAMVEVAKLTEGMILDEDLVVGTDIVLIPRGRELTPSLIAVITHLIPSMAPDKRVRVIPRHTRGGEAAA